MAERAVPIPPSRDLRRTLAFCEALGFENRGERGYPIVARGGIEPEPATGSRPLAPSGDLVRVGSGA